MNQLGDSKLYSTFDCENFFFQNRLRDEDSWMTAFSTCFGQFEWRVCPHKMASSPAVAQRWFSWILQSLPCVNADLSKHPTERRNLLAENAVVFLDDALVHGGSFEEHLGFIYSFLYAMEEQNQNKVHAPAVQLLRTCTVSQRGSRAARASRCTTELASTLNCHGRAGISWVLRVPQAPY